MILRKICLNLSTLIVILPGLSPCLPRSIMFRSIQRLYNATARIKNAYLTLHPQKGHHIRNPLVPLKPPEHLPD